MSMMLQCSQCKAAYHMPAIDSARKSFTCDCGHVIEVPERDLWIALGTWDIARNQDTGAEIEPSRNAVEQSATKPDDAFR